MFVTEKVTEDYIFNVVLFLVPEVGFDEESER